MREDDIYRELLGRILIGVFIVASLMVGPALAIVTHPH